MVTFNTARSTLLNTIFTLAVALTLSTFAFADPHQGRGHGRDKKSEKFVNGHDARDGRLDKHNKHHKHDRYDRNDDDERRERRRDDRDRDRDNDGINDRTEIRRQALSIGYQEGYRFGQRDRADHRTSDYNDLSVYRDADTGYRDSYGNRELYRRSFREGFRQGYEDGYRNRTQSGRYGRVGDILGDIFNRP